MKWYPSYNMYFDDILKAPIYTKAQTSFITHATEWRNIYNIGTPKLLQVDVSPIQTLGSESWPHCICHDPYINRCQQSD